MKLEICVGSVASAINAQAGGADRIELCDNLFEGGTTPSYGALKYCAEQLLIDTMVIIRPRGGDFLFDDAEFQVMIEDVKMAQRLGVHGMVIGALKADGHIDVDMCKGLVDVAGDMQVTFHRAFDMSIDWQQALEDVIEIGCARLLTSGQEVSAFEGAERLAQMVKQAGDRLIIMPGGGINARNMQKIIDMTGVQELHMSAHVSQDSGMQYQHTGAFMGGALRKPEFLISVASADKVADLKRVMS